LPGAQVQIHNAAATVSGGNAADEDISRYRNQAAGVAGWMDDDPMGDLTQDQESFRCQLQDMGIAAIA